MYYFIVKYGGKSNPVPLGANYFEPVEDEEGAKQFKEMVINRTREIYDIDVSDIYDGPLYAVLARIKNKQ